MTKEIDSVRNRRLNRLISIKETEKVIRELLHKETPDPDGFTGEFFQTVKDQIEPLLYNLFESIEILFLINK